MLKVLSIQNYALIKDIRIDFNGGLSIITGETGAGKSILLGALSLLIGQRADTSVLFDTSRKCIVEGTFQITAYGLEGFFSAYELDFANETNIRREITIDGKSRAFINDTPVNISVLKSLGDRLIDIHSQHENLYLENPIFQLEILDTIAKQLDKLNDYKEQYQAFKKLQADYQVLKENNEKQKSDLDYFQFQFNQLNDAKLKENELEELESEYQTLTHAEEIKAHLGFVSEVLSGEGNSLLVSVKDAMHHLQKIKEIYLPAHELLGRFDTIFIEIKDLSPAIERMANGIEHDQDRAEHVRQRLDVLYGLLQKHRISSLSELISLRNELSEKIGNIVTNEEKLIEFQKAIEHQKNIIAKIALEISHQRKSSFPHLEKRVEDILHQLGMPNAIFQIELSSMPDYSATGCDRIRFLFSANKQSAPQEISKVASGGEMARLMLSLKAIVAQSMALPTIIFDEIDSGVSGDIADKMGNIISNLSGFTQVINITHLPQIASKGKNHYLVYKQDQQQFTYTYIKLLTDPERVTEIAKMLSGEQLTDAAINNARELLKMVTSN
jgi:DNA repair protein RecN (Recombination protein N)